MRWEVGLAVMLSVALAGCGGGGGEAPAAKVVRTAEPHELTVSYLTSTVTVPRQETERFYQVSARLWMPDDAARLENLALIIPYTPKSMTLSGPSMVENTDGIHLESYPLAVYWGQGEAAGAGQPRIVRPGEWLPGYARPASNLYSYHGSKDFDEMQVAAGSYVLTDGAGLTAAWETPLGFTMLTPAEVTKPSFFLVNSKQPLVVGWNKVAGATGYLVYAEGEVKDAQNRLLGVIHWSSADRPILFDTVYDPGDYLLPSDTREVTIPANIFRECGVIQVHIFAMRAPFVDDTTTPSARINCGSLATQVYVMITP